MNVLVIVRSNVNVGAPALLNPLSCNGDVASGLATLLTPQSEFSMFMKFRMSTLS